MISRSAIDERWKLTFDSYDAPSIGRGSSGSILAINKSLVIKVFADDEEGQMDLERETSIYEILQADTRSPYIVHFIEQWHFGIVMERLDYSLRVYLRQKPTHSVQKALSWVHDACKGLDFLHSKGIMHGDVGCHNFLINGKQHLKLCDFAGSKREGETARICYEVRGQHPDYQSGQPTRVTELFALGSTIFEMFTFRPPYVDETDSVVQSKYKNGIFPLTNFRLGSIARLMIEKCWKQQYSYVFDVLQDVNAATITYSSMSTRPTYLRN